MKLRLRTVWRAFACGILLACAGNLPAQEKSGAAADHLWSGGLSYRLVGPFRGGRSAAVTGVPSKPNLFYMGATGGGVWRTNNAGESWTNISDHFFGGSIGAVEVSQSDPNVIYVGGGEETVRGNVSHGDGVWKSTDTGKTWKHMGLEDTRTIPRVRVHPKNPDLVYVAALGHLYGPSKQRGVFRSNDGGATWKNVLFVNDEVGAVDLILDPNNPRIIYASTWRVKRTPYSLESGGPGSGLWKSTDSGDTWKEITRAKGLPQGTVGIIGVAVSPVNSERVWSIVEAEDGGVFRSENAGETWTKTSEDRNLRQRAWYYTRIYAGTKNIDDVWVVNVGLHRSNDGGKTFSSSRTPHGDHHDLWIDPNVPSRMIVADDGGAQVSVTGGAFWSTYMNQPTAQFYRVSTDNAFPYRIYGAQQDNSALRIRSHGEGGNIGERDWDITAGGESGFVVASPKDSDIVYGGSYGNFIERINHRTREIRNINVWPDNPLGHGAGDSKYRFQWNFPIFFSPHDANTIYAAGNALFKSNDEGQSWIPISADLTRNDKAKLGPSGGPITKDNTAVEYYCTIFAAIESPLEKGLLWCGSDDGLLHVSKDAGKNWSKVTPPDLPEWSMINSLEAHPTEKGGLYLVATRYKLDDFRPYIFKTTDYGKTWTKIVTGINDVDFTRVVRADPKRAGLLYCGTENGMYISFDDGAKWRKFQLNLPLVPITDLTIKDDDLVVATQGRSFWVLDDLTPLHQFKPELAAKPLHLFQPRPSYRLQGGGGFGDPDAGGARGEGQNPPNGTVIRFHLKDAPAKGTASSVQILDAKGAVIREFKSDSEGRGPKIEPKAGMNKFVWNHRYADAEDFPGMILWGSLTGPQAVPGSYTAKVKVGSNEESVAFEVKPDPRTSASPSDFEAQFKFLLGVRDKLTEAHESIKTIRDVRDQLTTISKRVKGLPGAGDIEKEVKEIDKKLTAVEEALYQTKAKSPQDVLNFPIRLNNKLASLAGGVGMGDNRPTDQSEQVRKDLVEQTDAELSKFHDIMKNDLPKFNELLEKKKIPGVIPQSKPAAK